MYISLKHDSFIARVITLLTFIIYLNKYCRYASDSSCHEWVLTMYICMYAFKEIISTLAYLREMNKLVGDATLPKMYLPHMPIRLYSERKKKMLLGLIPSREEVSSYFEPIRCTGKQTESCKSCLPLKVWW